MTWFGTTSVLRPRPRCSGLAWRVCFFLALLTACKPAGGGETADHEARLEARGLEVYKEQSCGTCHTLTRAGAGGVFGPSHDGVGTHAEERIRDPAYHGEARTAEQYLRESILDPPAYRVPGYGHTRFAMPAYTELPDSDLEALVHLLESEKESSH